MFGGVEKIVIDNGVLEYWQYDVGFRALYNEREENGFTVFGVDGVEFIVFRTSEWIYLYPKDIDDFVAILNAVWDDERFYAVSKSVGKVYFPRFLFGTRVSNWNTPPPESNHEFFAESFSSSYLTENINGTVKRYSPDNLLNWDISKGWVDGSSSDGTGEELKLILPKGQKADKLIIYSGFFDPSNLALFYQNARPREIEIYTDSGNITSVDLEDTPAPQFANTSEISNSFTIIIKSVYPGSIYDDCAIAGVFVDRENLNYP